jgi:hypothetical protein
MAPTVSGFIFQNSAGGSGALRSNMTDGLDFFVFLALFGWVCLAGFAFLKERRIKKQNGYQNIINRLRRGLSGGTGG